MSSESSEAGDSDASDGSDPDSATGRAWVGCDATFHEFIDSGFKNKSEIGLAIAVDDREEFNTKYRSVIEEKAQEYGFSPKRPVLKTHTIRDYATEWEYDNILSDFVEELLQIDNIENIHSIITTITNQMVKAYDESRGPHELLSRDQLHGELTNYYHLIAVWDYLEEYRDAPWGTADVLLDDFEGKDNYPWRRTGRISDELHVIPRGDYTYPLLSLADLTMDYIKENVDEWTEEEIEDVLIEVTPDDSAFVNVKGMHTPDEVGDLVPTAKRNIKRSKHYPHPIVFIDRGGVGKEELMQFDIYHVISEYVYENSGCMKFFSETEDGSVVQEDDYIVCLDESDTSKYKKYEEYNNSANVVLTPEEVFDTLN